ncbi:chaperonin GroEL, partial [Candidatus Beckwithbacteria bacterium]|nr:chaperonin GroEL [Candidatus Beckwithbacteria bacterium]
AAVEEGVVAGGGVALLRARKALVIEESKNENKVLGLGVSRKFKNNGAAIVFHSLEAPIIKLISNARGNAAYIVGEIEKNTNPNYGFNVKTMEDGDLVKMGVLDPAKVVRTALQNASSVAGVVLTTEALVADKPEEKKEMPMMPGGMGGGMPMGM